MLSNDQSGNNSHIGTLFLTGELLEIIHLLKTCPGFEYGNFNVVILEICIKQLME